MPSARYGSKVMKAKYGEEPVQNVDRQYMIKVFGEQWVKEAEANGHISKPSLLSRVISSLFKRG